MLKAILLFIVAVAVGGAIGADDSLSDFSNDLFTDLGPLLALFGDSMTRQYLSESTSFLDYFIFAMCPIGIIATMVSAIRLCGHSSLRAFIGRSQEGNGVVEAELCTSTSRDVCELFSGGGIARVLGRPTTLELVQVQEQQPSRTAGLHLSRHYFTMDEATSPWTRVKDSYNGSLGSSASNPPNLSLNVGIVKQDGWKFIEVAILGFILQAGILALAGLGGWILQWNLAGTGNLASRNYAPIMFIIGTSILCGGMWSCATLIGESTREIRYKRKPGVEDSSQLIWLQPHQVIGDQSFDPFAYRDQHMNITRWTASMKKLRDRQHKMTQFSTLFGVTAVLIGYVMQFIGLRGMKAWVSLTQLGITITMSILRGLLRMQRLDSNGNDNALAGQPDLVEGYELEWLAYEITKPESSSTGKGSSQELQSTVLNRPPARGVMRQKVFRCSQSLPGVQRTSEMNTCNVSGVSTPTRHGVIPSSSRAASSHRQDSNNLRLTIHQENVAPFQNSDSPECFKHGDIQAGQQRLLSTRKRLSHLTGHIPLTISLKDDEFIVWRDKFVKVRSKAKEVSAALESVANNLFHQKTARDTDNTAMDIEIRVRGFFDIVHCATCDHKDPVKVNMKATKGPYGITWAVDSAKIESLLGLTMWSLLSDERTTTKGDQETPFKTSWCDGIQTRRIISVDSGVDDLDRISHAQTEVDLWLGSNRLEVSQARTVPTESTKFNLRDLWRNSQGDEWSALDPSDDSESDKSLVRFCGWTWVSTPFETSEIRSEHPVEWTTTSSRHTDSRPMVQVQYTVAQGSLLDTCAKELFSTLISDLRDEMDIESSAVKELDGEVRLESPTVDALAKIFVDAGLGSYSEALPYILPALRNQLYIDSLEVLFKTLLNTAETFRKQSHWRRAETLVQWACTKYFQTHRLRDTEEKYFIRAFIAAGELYRLSLCQTESAERTEFGNIGIKWMFSTSRQFSKTRGNKLYDEIKGMIPSYRHVMECFRTDPNGTGTLGPLKEYIAHDLRTKALQYLCLKRRKDLVYQAPIPGLLVSVTRKDWLEVLTALLEMQVDPNSRDEHNRSAIFWAIELNHDLCALALIDHGASLEDSDPAEDGTTPMVLAARLRHNGILRHLIDSGRVDIDKPDENGITPLIEAINRGHEDTVHLLLSQGADINRQNHNFMTMLDRAAQEGLEARIDFLVANGAAVNGQYDQLNRPLHWALMKRHEQAAQLLVDRGASVDTPTRSGTKPIHFAAEYCSKTMVEFLLRNGASIEDMTEHGLTPLSLAAQSGNERVVRLLLEKGASIEALTKYGSTPLSLAAQSGQEKVVQLLLEKGASIYPAGSTSATPLFRAVQNTHKIVVNILLENGASMEDEENGGETLLREAEDQVRGREHELGGRRVHVFERRREQARGRREQGLAQPAEDGQGPSWTGSPDQESKDALDILEILTTWSQTRGQGTEASSLHTLES